MSISERKRDDGRLIRWLIGGTGASAFLTVFNVLYTSLSYGESSPHMRWAFLFPLVLCAMPAALFLAAGRRTRVPRLAYNLWNGGVATLVCGCLLRGIVDIAGRTTGYDRCYYLLGAALLIISVSIAAAAELQAAGRGRR